MKAKVFQIALLCFFVLLTTQTTAQADQKLYQTCVRQYRAKQYLEAITCIQKLYQKTQKQQHLRNWALFHEKAGEHFANSFPSRGRYQYEEAVKRYQEYLRKSPSIDGNEKTELLARIGSLTQKIAYASFNITTIPPKAKISLKGFRFQHQTTSPHLFSKILPGVYRLLIQKKGYQKKQIRLELKPRQALTKTYQLQKLVVPKTRRPSTIAIKVRKTRIPPKSTEPKQGMGWTPMLITAGGSAAFIAVGAALGGVSANQLRTGYEAAYKNTNWHSDFQSAQTMVNASRAFYIIGGLAGAATLGLLIAKVTQKPAKIDSKPTPPKTKSQTQLFSASEALNLK